MTDPSRTPAAAGTTALTGLTDPGRCPSCGAALNGPQCAACGVDLSGPDGALVWRLSTQAGALLAERDRLLSTLRQEAARRSRPLAAPAAAPAAAIAVPPPFAPAPGTRSVAGITRPRPVAIHRALLHRLGVQGLLVSLGALLLSVAALTFLVLSWDRMGLALRAAVVAGLTAAMLLAAGWLRPRLASTAEAVGALAVVLVLADGWAVRRLGLFGADLAPGFGYSAGVALVAAALLGGWAVVTRVRAGSVAAAVLLPSAAVLAGLQGWASEPGLTGLATGLLAGAAAALARPALPTGWSAERLLLTAAAGGCLALLLPLPLLIAGDLSPWSAGLVAAAAAVLAAGLCWTERPGPALGQRATDPAAWLRLVWSMVAGGYLAVAGAVAGYRPSDWAVLFVPLGAVAAVALGLVAVQVSRPWRTGVIARLHPPTAALAASAVVVLTALPAAGQVLTRLLAAASSAFPAWRFAAGDPLRQVLAGFAAAGPADPADPAGALSAGWIGGVGGLLLAAVALPVLARGGRVPGAAGWLPAAAVVAGVAVVALPLAPQLPVIGAVLALVALSALAAAPALTGRWSPGQQVAGRPASGQQVPGRPVSGRLPVAVALLPVSGLAGGLAVLLGWSVRPLSVPLSVPVTLVGASALLGARRVLPRGPAPTALTALAAVATLVAAGALPQTVGWQGPDPWSDRLLAAGLTGAVLAAVALCRPVTAGRWGWPPAPADRSAVAVPAIVAGVLAVGASARITLDLEHALLTGRVGAVPSAIGPELVRLQVLLGCWLAVAGLVVLVGRIAPARVAAAATVLPLSTGLLLALARGWTPDLAVALLPAVLVAVGAGVLALLALTAGRSFRSEAGRAGDPWLAACWSAAGCGLISLLLIRDLSSGWVVLLLLGSGAAAVATAPSADRVGWVGGLLLTGSTWARLMLSDVSVVEAYTLPPALALLGLAALRIRRNRRPEAETGPEAETEIEIEIEIESRPAPGGWRVGLAGAGLALGPSLLATADGADLRPAVLIGLAAVVVLAAWPLAGRAPRAWSVALAAAAVAAAGAGLVRGVVVAAGSLPWQGPGPLSGPERWSVPAGLVVAAAGVLAARATAAGPSGRVLGVTAGHFVGTGMLVAGLPTLLAVAVRGPAGPRSAGVLIGAAVVALASAWLRRPALAVMALAGPVHAVATGLLLAAAAAGVWFDAGPATEVWTVSAGAVLVALAERRLAGEPALASLPVVGPGLLLALLPSLWLASHGGPQLRVALLAGAAAAVLLAGIARGWLAPTVTGAAVLAAHAVVQLAPRLVDAYQATPRWVSLGLVGLVLLGVGARYEQRITDLRSVRIRLAQLR